MIQNDFLIEIQLVGLTSRLKRLTDNILYSTKDFYKAVGVDIEPNWHLIFLLLKKHRELTVTEISERLQMSHPAIVKIIRNMKLKDYIGTKTDTTDSRKQLLYLTTKAELALPQLEKCWEACILTMEELLEGNEFFLKNLELIEEKIGKKSYKERTLKNLNRL
ncbi:MarR family winged helix-turn-helix transcriptional regulator [Flavobacterium sp. LS1R47]|jgi:MarR family transcriptional repressor of emrRAB|uniref:MarR family winged helix-turn-helix transcriptional regulator n=1 Tax=Flavobacterium frigoritolerans TaxID=2987686 RepID=A0A9X3C9J9_9FLAO|nr:helix-turn-helix domain-containing protein [Flavobacterium frigoritolerans]MCV9934120.1 MarR family winged helix-turn-helix transcriptional regulator [Flavobacterium frigoritolerans]